MKRLAIVGAGVRCYGPFAKEIKEKYSDKVELVSVCDWNIKRCEFYRDTLNPNMQVYTDFDLMLKEVKPDAVLITTQDCYHHEYIIKAMDSGCDVFCEKPMTIDEEKCMAIREAEKRTGKKLTVTFNCRFMPYFVQLKEIVASGVIGKPLAIHYEYLLNTVHGGDYFKRWHRFMENSGGMLVHKSTHHFDIVNWILEDEPESVIAQGKRLYFGNDDRPHGTRCSTCDYKADCVNFDDFSQEHRMENKLFMKLEGEGGYVRDHCPFNNDTNIYDSMSVSVAYKKGTLLTYSLNLFSTDEGYTLNIIGEKGRIETSTFFEGDKNKIIVRYRDGRVDELYFPKATGGHMGGDVRMVAMLFGGLTDDPLGQCADSFDGIKSVMVGVAANQSIKEGKRVHLTPILDKMR